MRRLAPLALTVLVGCNTIVGLSSLDELPDATTSDTGSVLADTATSDSTVDTRDAPSIDTGSSDTAGDSDASDTEIGTDTGVDTAIADTADAGSLCPKGKGPDMVQIGTWCIDKTEVTVGQYATFLASGALPSDSKLHPPGSGPEDVCAWNTSFAPSKASDTPNAPVTYVDWCDAYAFCKWAGKRLCGALASDSSAGGATPWGSALNPAVDQWLYACTNGNKPATFVYPYGTAYATICNDASWSAPIALRNVGALPKCRGATTPYDQIVDMSGNAFEWGDSCNRSPGGTTTPAKDLCIVRGGAYVSTVTTKLRCTDENEFARDNNTFDGIGFRCCAY